MPTPKSAIVTGVTGQGAAYLARNLLEHEYRVFGTYRRTSSVNFWCIEDLGIARHPELHLAEFDLLDPGSSMGLLASARPQEVYNLAVQSFPAVPLDQPVSTGLVTGIGAVNP